MKFRIILFINLFMIYSALFASEMGYMLDYVVEGSALGGTSIQGSIKTLYVANKKRMSCDFFYLEAGKPFPDLHKKDIIVNFSINSKMVFISEFDEWLDTALSDDSLFFDGININTQVEKKANKIIVRLSYDMGPEFGGSQSYMISFVFPSKKSSQEIEVFGLIKKPLSVDFLSVYLENETLVRLICEKMGDAAKQIPDSFSILWEQNGKVKLDIMGTLTTKLNLIPDSKSFEK